jgi:hypothetical protein
MRANKEVFRDVRACSSECSLSSMKPWKLFTAFQAKCRVSNRKGYASDVHNKNVWSAMELHTT